MVNTSEFKTRLETIMTYFDLSASAFAEAIGVQRSSISHLLSGRNKPSLDFVLKVIKRFPEADLYWLLNGKGDFPKLAPGKPGPQKKAEKKTQPTIPTTAGSEVEKIIVFYRDGHFREYHPS